MTSRALYLDAAGEPAFAVLHEPARPSGCGVVIVPPFGWDEVASYRPRRAWAERLAGDGHAALRLDLPGTGDSAGGPRDPARMQAWSAAVVAATAWLREAGAGRVCVIGIGLGASVAALAAAEGAAVADLVLWGASADGRRLLRGLRAFAALQADADEPEALAPGGHVLSDETAAAIERLDLTGLDLGGPPGRRALLLGRDRPPRDRALAAHLEACGFEVSTAAGPGFAAMTTTPDGAQVPHEVVGLVARWLRPPSTGAFSAGVAPAAADITVAGAAIRETPFSFAAGGVELFGVLAEPAAPAAELTAVLLNAGAIRRTGPNRMWVEAARRWAARGVATLRLDLEGIGDAAGDAAVDADVTLYVPHYSEQVRAALDALADRGLPQRFVLAGLCSGAYWALHAALDDERVAAAVMLNPRLLVWDAQLVRAREARRVLTEARGPAWARSVRGTWSTARLRRVSGALGNAVWTRLTNRGAEADPEPTVQRVAARSARFTIAFSGGEPLACELERAGLLAALRGLDNVEIASLPGTDHTLRPLQAQRAAHAVLDRGLAAVLT